MGVASSIKTNFNKITCFISHLTKYIRVKESKTLKIKITLKKSKKKRKKKKRNRANPLRLIKIYINWHQENVLSIPIYILAVQSAETPITVF